MKPGDLVKLDTPGQRPHGKIGLVVSKNLNRYIEWMCDSPWSFSYDVMVDGELWLVSHDEILEIEGWRTDETR